MKKIQSEIYYWLLVVYAASVVWSVFMMFLMPTLLLVHWLVSGNWASRWQQFKQRKSIWATAGIVLLYVVGMSYSSDMSNAWKLTRFLLPSLAGALVVGTQEPLSDKQLKQLFYIFILSVSLTAVFNLFRYLYLLPEGTDIRKMSRFMSHIRYSLFIVLSNFIAIYYLFKKRVTRKESIFLIANLIWLTVFLFLLQSFTGITLFFLIGIGTVFYQLTSKIKKRYALILLALLMLPFAYASYITYSEYKLFFEKKPLPKSLPAVTALGNPYFHDTSNYKRENGYLIDCFVCEFELVEAWNKRSKIPYSGEDFRKQYMCNTIRRYITSKGLTKDAAGVAKLSDVDIKNIESGYTNCNYTDELSFRSRIHSTLWQMQVYERDKYVNDGSLSQRLVFYQCAALIIADHFWFGVGTGDGASTMLEYYPKLNVYILKEHQLDSHCQYLNALVAFGIFGASIIAFLLGVTIWIEKRWKSYLFVVFFIILLLSMVVEDTLNTFAGATFYGLFWTILVFAFPHRKE